MNRFLDNKLSPGDIFSIRAQDTVFNSGAKIYAQYKGISFQRYMYDQISKDIKMDGRQDNLVAFFQISKTGVPDSLKIIKGVDPNFDGAFLAAFSRAKKDWSPAVFRGKDVAVRMKVQLQYSTSDAAIPSDFADRDGDGAFNNKDYSVALYYFDLAYEKTPFNPHLLYKRGLCKLMLGNAPWACQDWQLALKVGDDQAVKTVLLKYCK